MKMKQVIVKRADRVVQLMFCMLTFFVSVSCSASTGLRDAEGILGDTIVCKALGDSVCNILLSAKSIQAYIPASPVSKDSLAYEVKLNKEELPIAKFLVTDPINYESNIIVYGLFDPQFSLVFTKKKEVVKVHFDFGLKKWKVCNVKDEDIVVFDLKSQDIHRFASIIFHGLADLSVYWKD